MSNAAAAAAGVRRILAPMPPNARKDRDEDLLLFRELHKRDKDRIVSLLQPVSDEFEPSGGNYSLYRMASAKKGSAYEFLAENEKNDYDWLKTPPATPLFPSLEMESTALELVVHRELPIIQPLSRFSGNPEESKAIGRPKTPNPIPTTITPKAANPNSIPSNVRPITPNAKPKVPQRSVTPGQKRPSISSNIKPATILNQRTTPMITEITKKTNLITSTPKSTNQRETQADFLTSNISKEPGTESKTKPRSRGVSPQVRSTIPAQIPGFSNETPSNLRTDRSTSASRDRPGNPTIAIQQKPTPGLSNQTDRSTSASRDRARNTTKSNPQKPIQGFSNETPPNLRTDRSTSASRGRPGNLIIQNQQNPEPIINPRRQSCSPSMSRGRKPDSKQGNVEGRNQIGNGTQVLGSRMVDKLMNARKFGAEERETRPESRDSNNQTTGFGRMISKSSLETAIKHMDLKQDRTGSRRLGVVAGRTSRRRE